MAKSLRSKMKKRLRTLRREIVEPFYDKKDSAKLAVQEAALNAPKLPIPPAYANNPFNSALMDVEMTNDGSNQSSGSSLKPSGGVGKKLKKKLKFKKGKRGGGKGKIRKKKV